VASSGFRDGADVAAAFSDLGLDGVAIGSALHSKKTTISDIRQLCKAESLSVR
jgi:imidazole glycerol phosphate synthase subunit HisF